MYDKFGREVQVGDLIKQDPDKGNHYFWIQAVKENSLGTFLVVNSLTVEGDTFHIQKLPKIYDDVTIVQGKDLGSRETIIKGE